MEAARHSLIILALCVFVLFAVIGPSPSWIGKDSPRRFATTTSLLVESDVTRRMLMSETHHQKTEKTHEEKRDLAKDSESQNEATKDAPSSIPKDYVLSKCSHHCEMVAHSTLISPPPPPPPAPVVLSDEPTLLTTTLIILRPLLSPPLLHSSSPAFMHRPFFFSLSLLFSSSFFPLILFSPTR